MDNEYLILPRSEVDWLERLVQEQASAVATSGDCPDYDVRTTMTELEHIERFETAITHTKRRRKK